ncbi:NAD+ synthase [Thermocrinis minervae]|uniref:Glutamine-dependent NAD(+) synthetase n=1 Tax=Thermocrinis minervae TaxID=381751 RepID=A0A1M6RPW6_9AQUI|nr:NAD+ synthase [Thermocrinis minervae]SHK34367.1 NH(3)-dependent NAD(+) synthetase [Thermocrinis minervae]
MNITLAQVKSHLADPKKNAEKALDIWTEYDKQSDLVVLPELFLSGYACQDLFLRLDFLTSCMSALDYIKEKSSDLSSTLVIGTPYYEYGNVYNALVLINRGRIIGVYKKWYLPNYTVFDEKRYFKEGKDPLVVKFGNSPVGFAICEDIWYPDGPHRLYVSAGCPLVVSINASPFYLGRYKPVENLISSRSFENVSFFVYLNKVGAEEEYVFDGRSMVFNEEGKLLCRLKAFEEHVATVTLDLDKAYVKRLSEKRLNSVYLIESAHVEERELPRLKAPIEESPGEDQELYMAILLGIKDYVSRSGFKGALIGLSGGIDSSLCACLAVDALGKERVVGVFMPSEYTSKESHEDVHELVKNLGIELIVYPINELYHLYRKLLGSSELTVAEENLQARIRANILFYLSNKLNYLVLSTSNKSEAATGYGTIYGDMAGGFMPLKDVYKTQVYRLALYRNSIKRDIPERVLVKPPSAELRPNQTDQDTLPPYHILDRVLYLYIEEGLSAEDIVQEGFEKSLVEKVIGMVNRTQYKRRQTPLGVRVSKKSFCMDWRMPVNREGI